ncbi:MAG: UvrD-helicase domain-containing protein [Methanomicrobiales archaeon]|nr:UvrD-helicase domain-containing protein [Methanomicrobiales archaeon]
MAATPRQKEAITCHDRSMVVTAGAGTGKTFVLVEKYLDLVESQGYRPGEILALTFTDKAAAEMRARVRSTIAGKVKSEPDNPVWREASLEVIIAPIMTFHAFCAQILREFAIEAGLEPGFIIMDKGQATAVRRDAFDSLLRKPSPDVHEALVRVLAQIEKYRLQEVLTSISYNYAMYMVFFSTIQDDPGRVITKWQEFLREVREPVIRDFFADCSNTDAIDCLIRFSMQHAGENDSAARYLDQVAPHLACISLCKSEELLAAAVKGFLSVRPIGRIGSRKVWDEDDLARLRTSKAYLTRSLERAGPYFALTLDPDSPFTRATVRFFADLALIASQYMAIVGSLKKQASGVDFGDLINLTKQFLLEHQGFVATHLTPRYRYILIDEFQDTDPAQFEIITAIIGDLTPDTRRLFIVGDPKQSIYLFRDADVTRFKAAQVRIMSDCKGRLINLDTSFRSTREVLGCVNHLFQSIFASTKKPWEFGYEPLSVCEEKKNSRGSVLVLLPKRSAESSRAADHKEIEAGMVAEMVHQLVFSGDLVISERGGTCRPAEYGDIAILLERRTHLSSYLNALAQRDTPIFVHGGIGFYTRPEIYDIYNLLSFLIRPYDDAALYGLLRSPYFSLSDTTLFCIQKIEGARRGATLYERMQMYLTQSQPGLAEWASEGPLCPGAEREKVARAYRLLYRWIGYTGRESVVLLMARVLRESGVLVVYGALPQGEQQVANLEKLIEIARGREEGENYALNDLVSEISASINAEEREGEAALDTVSRTSVNIMTVHAAKGLEFPVVILPDMGSSREGRQPPILSGDNQTHMGVKIPNPDHDYEIEETPVYTALLLIQKEKEAAERKRLFYVGATRARDHLVFCGRQPSNFSLALDESNNRIDWVCSLLGITQAHISSGDPVLLDPGDGGEPIEVRVLTDPDQLTRDWARAQAPVVILPPEYQGQSGRRINSCTPDDAGVTALRHTVLSLSRIINKGKLEGDIHERALVIPGCGDLGADETGNLLHQVFSGKDAASTIKEYGITSPVAAAWCSDAYTKFLNHPLMQGVEETFCELAFVTSIGEYTVEGRMDRLCRRSDGSWMVIDYKSGDDPGVKFQLNVYRLAAEHLLDTSVAMYLYTLQSGEMTHIAEIGREEVLVRIKEAVDEEHCC